MLACQLVYKNDNWFLEPMQPVGVYMANRNEIDKCLDSNSMFVTSPMKLEFKNTVI